MCVFIVEVKTEGAVVSLFLALSFVTLTHNATLLVFLAIFRNWPTIFLGCKIFPLFSALFSSLFTSSSSSSFSNQNEQMGLVSSFLGILGFAVGIPLGLFVGFFLFVYSETKHVKVNITTLIWMFVLFYSKSQHCHMHVLWSLSGDCWCWGLTLLFHFEFWAIVKIWFFVLSLQCCRRTLLLGL